MKKIITILSIVLLTCCSKSQLDNDSVIQDVAKTRSITEVECDYDALANLFEEDVRMLDETTKNHSVNLSSNTPFTHSLVRTFSSNQKRSIVIDHYLIFVNEDLYDTLEDKIFRYASDIAQSFENYDILIIKVNGGNHTDIKDLILTHRTNLRGVTFIGEIPAAFFEIANDHNKYNYRSWPCDLYYMDLDGIWGDIDGNGIFDTHTGNIKPEIFVGRISAKNMGKNVSEIDCLNNYFDKNHDFWSGTTIINNKLGLSYTDKDWVNSSGFKTDIQYLYGGANYVAKSFGDSGFGKAEYLGILRDQSYEFIQLSCHASPTYLSMSGGGISSNEIFTNGTDAIGYNLFCCSACNWTAIPESASYCYLAGAHIYNPNKKSLVVVGSTKTGSMLKFKNFYTPLAQKKSIGEALKIWWNALPNEAENYRISWYYGLTIIGDPMINFFHKASGPDQITLNGFDAENTSPLRNIVASSTIIANNYIIPPNKQVTFNAPNVILNSGFTCSQGATFVINN